MKNRKFFARELCFFAKNKQDISINGEYLLVGYLNNQKTKFKDLKTNVIYSIDLHVLNVNNNIAYPSMVICVNGQTFVQTDMSINQSASLTNPERSIGFSSGCIFTDHKYPFLIMGNGSNEPYSKLYKLVDKYQNTPVGVVSGQDILDAVDEANKYAKDNLVVYSNTKQEWGERKFVASTKAHISDSEREF